MACISNALIIGGGIAGLSAAIALSRIGVQCDVVELSDTPLGASLGISGRAAEALVELGIYDQCHDTGRPWAPDSTALHQWNAQGDLISPGPQRPAWPGAKQAIGVYRPVFLKILADEARRLGAQVRIGVTARSFDERDEGSCVTFTDGEERRYDMVVGADGISSRTRAALFPDAAGPIYAGQMSIRWMAPGPAIEPEGWYIGPVGRLGFYYHPHQSEIYVPAVISIPEWKRMTDAEVHELFTRLLDSYAAPAIVELRSRLTPDSRLIGRPFEWTLLPAPWHKGRTILIGDAAHATTAHMGMGGGMALEDSVVLAQSVAQADTLAEAFDAFMARRFDRVRTVVETSVGLSRLEQAEAPLSENIALLTAAFQALGKPY
jgi:2-polyprenyl-6-methoxyphenol hydroxylase-like FAD-dependent oxidoreductase